MALCKERKKEMEHRVRDDPDQNLVLLVSFIRNARNTLKLRKTKKKVSRKLEMISLP